jgi:hypothetical protein
MPSVEGRKLAMAEMALRNDAQSMKKQSGYHRSKWILHSGSRVDAQLSFVGRALPPAPPEAVTSALRQHLADLTSTFVTPSDTLSACTEFVRRWARDHLVRWKLPLGSPDWPTGSSCVERSASKGGLLGYLTEVGQDAPIGYEPSEDGAAVTLAMEDRLVSWAMSARDPSQPLRHRVTCLSERGLKTRVVTVGPAHAQVLGHTVRKRLLAGLKSTNAAYQPLVGASDEEIIKSFVGCCGDVLISTDLTRASDLLPLDLVRAVVDGLEASDRVSPLEIEVLRELSGPQLLSYPDGSTALSSRGILMGLPTTWVLLSLIHLFWVDHAKRVARVGLRRAPRFHGAICGDDGLLALNANGAAAYIDIVKNCGGEASPGKHYECSSGPTRRCVFLEKLFEFGLSADGTLAIGSRFPAIPVKGLTSFNLPRDFTEGRLVSCKSFGIRQIVSIDAIAAQGDCLLGPLRDYVRHRASWLSTYSAEVLGLTPGFPLRLGGYILGPRPVSGKMVDEVANIRDSGRSFSMAIKLILDPLWRMAAGFSGEGRELAVSEGELVDLGPDLGMRPTVHGLPCGDSHHWQVATEDARYLRTVTGMFRQLVTMMSAPRQPRPLFLRAQDFVLSRRRLVKEGASRPSGLPVDQKFGPALIAWKTPNGGLAGRGVSWFDSVASTRSVEAERFWSQFGYQLRSPATATEYPRVAPEASSS